MRPLICALAATLLMIAAPALAAPAQLALQGLPARAGARLTVTSPAFVENGAIPFAATAYGANRFPGLSWTRGPAGTKSYAVVVQDTDPPNPATGPLLHWTLYNLPAGARSVAAGAVLFPAGSGQSPTLTGRPGYFGPRPPPGPAHHYHFQVFALDQVLPLKDGAGFDQLLGAMKGHVLASGEAVGSYRAR